MRLYLDTNVLIRVLTRQRRAIDDDTWEMLTDYSNVLYTSSVCVHEFIYLLQSGKVGRGKDWKSSVTVRSRLDDFGINIVPIYANHLDEEERLPLLEGHRDPNDRLIIAQAIADKATLVSSDTKFPLYIIHGLSLHYNRR